MTSDSYNPNDPLFLVSESIDDMLSPETERALRVSLDASDQLQAEAVQLKRVAQIITRFAARKPTLDWDAHAEKILARIADQCSDDSLDEVDQTLVAWGQRDIDDATPDLATTVLKRAHAQTNRNADPNRSGHNDRSDRNDRGSRYKIFHIPWLAKVAIPLAVAAAIVLAVIPSVWNQPTMAPICVVNIHPQHKAVTDSKAIKPRSDVRFVRIASVLNEPRPTDTIGLLSVGAG